MKLKHKLIVAFTATGAIMAVAVVYQFSAPEVPSALTTTATVSMQIQASNWSDHYTVTRPIRETHTKEVKYTVMRPVREERSKTITYTQMTVVREARTKTDPITGKEITYTVARHLPEQREKVMQYVVTNMVPEQQQKTIQYQTVRFETTNVPRLEFPRMWHSK